MRKQLVISLLLVGLLILVTAGVILYGMGYRFSLNKGNPAVSGTGLLVTTSVPDGAQVFINEHLTTATDNTINLEPAEYNVKIFKDGYFPWQKKIIIKKEVVSKADALLLPTAPKLESITNVGVSNAVIDPTNTKLAYAVASQSALKNGIYVLDMTLRPILTLQSASTQIATDTITRFSQSLLTWSPDSKQILASFGNPSTTDYLLSATSLNPNPQDVTETLLTVNLAWQKLRDEKQIALNNSLPKKLRPIVSKYFNVLEWSDDETKVLYSASISGELPVVITPPLIGVDSTPQQRNIIKDSIYVYDVKEDRNYKILDNMPKTKEGSSLPLMWFPDSKHLIFVHNGKIDIMEYNSLNQTTVYAGPFVDNFVFPWPDGSKIVILTNLGNPANNPNLYTISLK
ncbi:MAG: PEGA domain-containing protein [Candidatus Levybacteria bacterium]|nr:PEGA domain-containing protein [Candidatus Levybacteria bacterium]